MKLTPTIFFGHGSPMNAIEKNIYTKTWLELVSDVAKPKAIISISAHWETIGTKITSNKTNQKQKTIHDFYGFPEELYQIQYSPKGSEELVKRICELISEVKSDDSWGLDHGTWSVLQHIYPDADIPTLQLSIDKNKTLQEHYDFAKKLASLRHEGVLIIGSGNVVHNLREIDWHSNKPYSWAAEFSKIIKQAILEGNHEIIVNYKEIKDYHKSVPTPEHFIPLIYILALKTEDEKVQIFNENIDLASIDMMGVKVF